MTRRSLSTRDRARIFADHGGVCCLCGGKIDGTKERWIAEHIRPLGLLGEDGGDNLKPAHEACARSKTYGKEGDLATIAKAKRKSNYNIGAKLRGKGFPPAKRDGRASRPLSKQLPPRRMGI
jgi:5-methylcytosine-specific restriction protein A